MRFLRQKSKPTRVTFILLGFSIAFLATMAVRPVASLAEPIEPTEPPQLVFEPGGHDFGLRPLNWGSDQTTFQLRNAGAEAFQIGSPEIVGSGSGAFWTGNSNCYGATLQPGQSCFAQVYFGPYDAVEYTAQFRVSAGSYSFSADLTGVGGRAVFTPTSNSTDFGVAEVGSAGATREIVVSNVGNVPGGVFIAVISGGAVGSFDLLDESCTGVELAPSATCTLQVRFQPISEGVKKATLSLFGDSDGGAQIVLSGVGAVPDPVSTAAAGNAAGQTALTADAPLRSKGKRGAKSRRRTKRHHVSIQSARLVLRARGDG